MSGEEVESAESGDLCWTGEPHRWITRARDDGDAWFVEYRVCMAGCSDRVTPPGATS